MTQNPHPIFSAGGGEQSGGDNNEHIAAKVNVTIRRRPRPPMCRSVEREWVVTRGLFTQSQSAGKHRYTVSLKNQFVEVEVVREIF